MWSQHIFFLSITKAEEAQHLQLEPWAPTWKRRWYRKANWAYHYPTGSFSESRTRNSSWTVSLDPLCGVCDSLQQRHLLPWHQRQIFLPSRHQTRLARSNHLLSRASFRWAAVSGQKFFTVLSLHISNVYAKKKGIAKKLIQTLRASLISQEVDLVAGDFNGTAWRCRSRDNLSTIDEVFSDCALPTPQTSVVFSSPLAPFPFLDRLLVFDQMIKVATMRRGFICTSSIGITNGTIRLATMGTFASRNDQRVLARELKKRHISDVLSDHSLSAWVRNHLRSLVAAFFIGHHHKVTWWDSMSFLSFVSFISCFLHLVCFRCNVIITILMCTLSKRSSLTATT